MQYSTTTKSAYDISRARILKMEHHWQPRSIPNLEVANLLPQSQSNHLTRLKASSHHCKKKNSHQALTTLHSLQLFSRPVVLLTAGLWPQMAKTCAKFGEANPANGLRGVVGGVVGRPPLWPHTSKRGSAGTDQFIEAAIKVACKTNGEIWSAFVCSRFKISKAFAAKM